MHLFPDKVFSDILLTTAVHYSEYLLCQRFTSPNRTNLKRNPTNYHLINPRPTNPNHNFNPKLWNNGPLE